MSHPVNPYEYIPRVKREPQVGMYGLYNRSDLKIFSAVYVFSLIQAASFPQIIWHAND